MPSSVEFFFAPWHLLHESFFDKRLSFRRVGKCGAVRVDPRGVTMAFQFLNDQDPSPFSNLCSGILAECPSKNGNVFVTTFYRVVFAADKALRRALVLVERQVTGKLDSRWGSRTLSAVHSVQMSKRHLPGTSAQYQL